MKIINLFVLFFLISNVVFAETPKVTLAQLGSAGTGPANMEQIDQRHHTSSDFSLAQKIAITVAITGLLLVANDQRGFPGDMLKGFGDTVYIAGGLLAIGGLIYFDQKKNKETK